MSGLYIVTAKLGEKSLRLRAITAHNVLEALQLAKAQNFNEIVEKFGTDKVVFEIEEDFL